MTCERAHVARLIRDQALWAQGGAQVHDPPTKARWPTPDLVERDFPRETITRSGTEDRQQIRPRLGGFAIAISDGDQ